MPLTGTKLIDLGRTRVEVFLIYLPPVRSDGQRSGDILGLRARPCNVECDHACRAIVLDIQSIDFDGRIVETAGEALRPEYIGSQYSNGERSEDACPYNLDWVTVPRPHCRESRVW